MCSTRAPTGGKSDTKRRLSHYESLLTHHGDEEVVNSLEALMRAVTERLDRKSRSRRGRRRVEERRQHPTA